MVPTRVVLTLDGGPGMQACRAFKGLCSDTKLWEDLFWATFYHPQAQEYGRIVVLPGMDNVSIMDGEYQWLQLYKCAQVLTMMKFEILCAMLCTLPQQLSRPLK